jgi:hypothetical protein
MFVRVYTENLVNVHDVRNNFCSPKNVKCNCKPFDKYSTYLLNNKRKRTKNYQRSLN